MANLITIDTIKSFGIDLSENINITRFNGFIQIVQESKLFNLLGEDLYNDYLLYYNVKYTAINDYINKYLSFAVYDYYLRNGGLYNTALGLRQKQDNGTSETVNNDLQKTNSEIMQFHYNRLYTKLVSEDYTLWDKNEVKISENTLKIRSI